MESSPEEKLKERLGDSCDAEIARKIAEFGGLLSRNAAVSLLCRQNGIDLERRITLSEAKGMALPFSFQARVDRIFPVQDYPNSRSRSVRLHVSDESGEATVILWNEQSDIVKGEISIGDIVECRGAYFKGGEIGIGRKGAIKKEKGFPITGLSSPAYGLCNVEGTVREVEPDRYYEDRKGGEKKKLLAFTMCDDGACRRVVMWPPQSESQKVGAGDVLLLENVFFKGNELHADAFSRLVKRKSAGERFGKFLQAAVENDAVSFQIGDSTYRAGVEEALSLLRIRAVPPGVGADALIKIKSREMEGRMVKYFVEGERLLLLEVD